MSLIFINNFIEFLLKAIKLFFKELNFKLKSKKCVVVV